MKMIVTKFVISISVIFIWDHAFAQINFKQKQVDGDNYFAVMADNAKQLATPTNEIIVLKQLTNSNISFKYRFSKTYADDLKFTHKKYAVFYDSIEVKGMDFVIHEKDGIIQYVNGTYQNIENIVIKTSITEITAIGYAKTYFENKSKTKTPTNLIIENKGLCIIKNPLVANAEYELAYKILIDPKSANGKYVFVNAYNGSIITDENLICNTNSPGTAQTRYSGEQNFTTDQQGSQYRLREVRNGVTIKTLNANHETNEDVIVNSATDLWDSNDNSWTASEHGANQIATDAHWAMEKTYDYWLSKHNRNSIDNAGMSITGYVHVSNGFDNAYWHRAYNQIFYGDGSVYFRPLTSLDICAHELGHGICQYTSDLSYVSNTESQALNEGFSDIWAASVEAYAAPNKQRWLIGEEATLATPGYLRSMSNPPGGAFAPSSDTYGDANWNNQPDGHYRSGVLNKWYFLLSEGGNGINGIGNAYSVIGITISKAERIAYRTELLLNSTADYAMARTMSIQAAKDLYGINSCEQKAVEDAWYAVNVVPYSSTNNFKIIGPAILCANAQTYSLAGSAANITWAVNTNQVTMVTNGTSVTLSNNGYTGVLILMATIVTSCGTHQIVKQIQVFAGAPSPNSFTPYITQNGNTTYMSSYCNRITGTCGPENIVASKGYNPTANIFSPYSFCASGYITDPTANSITWSVLQTSSGTFHGYYNFNGNQFNIGINANYPNEWIILRCTRANICGSVYNDYRFYANGWCNGTPTYCQLYPNDPSCPQTIIGPTAISNIHIAPNPSSGQFVVKLNTTDKLKSIKEIIIKDKMGRQVYRQKFNNNQKVQAINLSAKTTDIYLVEVFDGQNWEVQKLSLQR